MAPILISNNASASHPAPEGAQRDFLASLDLIRRTLRSTDEAKASYPEYRLTRLVSARFEMDDADALALLDCK